MRSPNPRRSPVFRILTVSFLLVAAFGFPSRATPADAVVLYETGFEIGEGYQPAAADVPLWDQDMGWNAEGSGGSGLVTNFFVGYGQQAFVGFAPPATKDEVLSVWRPVGTAAPPPGMPVLKFSTLMQVVDSSNHRYDDFRWSVYNSAGDRLFTLDFDNFRGEIFYALNGENATFRSTGFAFSNDDVYLLEIYMNFARNDWQALLNGQVVVDAQPISTVPAARLDFSDVDAVWALREKGLAGDNYLLFDDYVITAEPTATIPPTLEIVGVHADGAFELLLHGERGLKYAVDVADHAGALWIPVQTNAPPEGVWSFVDATAGQYPSGIYRARQVP